MFAASFPKSGYDGSGDSWEIVVAEPQAASVSLSAIYDFDATANHHLSAVASLDPPGPSLYDNGYRYDMFQFTPGVDQIYTDGSYLGLAITTYNLVHSSQYGWLVIDWHGNGLDAFDENPNNFQGLYVDYFLLPLGRGEYILICLALLYATFLFYRNYQKKKELVF